MRGGGKKAIKKTKNLLVDINKKRLWLFRGVSLLAPVIVIVILESLLRITGIGFPTSYFLIQKTNSNWLLIENDHFGWLFFPPKIARTPTTFAFPLNKSTNTFRIIVFGESAALGDPRAGIGPWRFLEALLELRYPYMDAEVIPVAMPAINSHVLYLVAKECKRLQADLWLIYAGNNEFIGPYGPVEVFGDKKLSLEKTRLKLWIKQTKIGQLFSTLLSYLNNKNRPPTWKDIGLFQDFLLPPDDASRKEVAKIFKYNLEGIINLAKAQNIPVILSTVTVNLRDCGPFASMGTNNLNSQMFMHWNDNMEKMRAALLATNWEVATRLLRQAIEIAPQHAGSHFQLAWCLRAQRQLDEAFEEFKLARDLDCLPVRATSDLNRILIDLAQKYPSTVLLVDTEQYLRTLVADRIPGDEFFFDHVHFKPKGAYMLARCWAQIIEKFVPQKFQHNSSSGWPEFEACANRLGLSPWNLVSLYEQIIDRLSGEPYTKRIRHNAIVKQLVYEYRQLQAQLKIRDKEADLLIYRDMLKRYPTDPWLIINYAEFLELLGDYNTAIQQWQQLTNIWAHNFLPYFYLGRAYAKIGQLKQATQILNKVIKQQPNFAPAWFELAQIAVTERRYEDAERLLRKTIDIAPESSLPYLLLADVLANMNKRTEGLHILQELVAKKPHNWKARYLIGIEFAQQGKLQEAIDQLSMAAELKPDSPLIHYNLAVALAKAGYILQAREHLQIAQSLEPSNPEIDSMLKLLNKLILPSNITTNSQNTQ